MKIVNCRHWNISLAFFLMDIGKQCRPRSAPQNAVSDEGNHCITVLGCSGYGMLPKP